MTVCDVCGHRPATRRIASNLSVRNRSCCFHCARKYREWVRTLGGKMTMDYLIEVKAPASK